MSSKSRRMKAAHIPKNSRSEAGKWLHDPLHRSNVENLVRCENQISQRHSNRDQRTATYKQKEGQGATSSVGYEARSPASEASRALSPPSSMQSNEISQMCPQVSPRKA